MKKIVMGLDFYNQAVTGGVAMALTGQRVCPHHVPCVLIETMTEKVMDSGREENDNPDREEVL